MRTVCRWSEQDGAASCVHDWPVHPGTQSHRPSSGWHVPCCEQRSPHGLNFQALGKRWWGIVGGAGVSRYTPSVWLASHLGSVIGPGSCGQ